jgi:hypothetical protein
VTQWASGRWLLAALTGGIWISVPSSPPPPDVTAIAIMALAMWLFLFLGQVDRSPPALRPVSLGIPEASVASD